MIDRMLVVVFDTEGKAYQGKKALLEAEMEGAISVYAYAVIAKNADGTVTVRESKDNLPMGTLVGTPLGGLIGLLGGPPGFAIGTAVGLLVGATVDLHNASVGEDFISEVASDLSPNRFALVAEIQEDWTGPVDRRMEAIGGIVHRRALSDVKHTLRDEDTAAMKADLAQLKAENAQSSAERKAKLQEKMNQLDSKIQARLEKTKQNRHAAEKRAKDKADLLKQKAAAQKAKAAQIHN